MWVQQRIGPFPANKIIVFPNLTKRDNAENFSYKYVRIGVQAPQSPYVTETRDIVYKEKTEDGLPIINSDIVPQDTSTVSRMNGFKIGLSGATMKTYYINANEILEFGDLAGIEYFKVSPMQDADEYTIIEIQYLNNLTS